ncbi:hypothetical protein EOD42_10540 [Rhodovarius crocodyli]|uniref:Kazal-like domain-containing protein n=1 Tax=Rhodovarius crocodyli TaxID=1979269 RepID=A0A437MGR1_9PROT|nr:hypothetical protein [Rhodovarius crocodyli]RVT96836.1 hypothetical protein EOD42_10540 [Rhodovarius crocodyli]
MRRLVLSLLILLSACAETETRYLPPAGFTTMSTPAGALEAGDSCIATCQAERQQCLNAEQASAGACFGADSAISRGFNGCREGAAGCVAPPICLQNSDGCTETYNACYSRCGGVALQVRRPRQTVSDAMPSTPFVVPPLPGSAPVAAAPRRRTRSRPAPSPAE